MKRNWDAAWDKVEAEGACRFCGRTDLKLDPAHIIPRSRVSPGAGERAENIVPLCRSHHAAYDQSKLDILSVLTRDEQAYAVELVGLFEAYRRITGERWRAAA